MKESLLTDVFWHAGLFLALSALVIPALRYFKIPVALGYLLAGIALGPYALGALTETFPILDLVSLRDAQHVQILAELGIVLLLFVIGLEMTPRRLWQMRNLVFGLGGRASCCHIYCYWWDCLSLGQQCASLCFTGAWSGVVVDSDCDSMAA
jgi:Kef-type K+ transport system membrane component KefB